MILEEEQENYKTGWISIYRSIFTHWLAPTNRPFTDLEAWIYILVNVNHSTRKVRLGNSIIECKRGESINSLDTWAKAFKWNKSKVRRFLNVLQNDNMIRLKSVQKTTHLTVCKYDSYQQMRNDNETIVKHKRNDSETIVTPNNNVNNYNNENNINISFDDLKDFFIKTTGKKIRVVSEKTKKEINKRLKEGYTLEHIKKAITNCYNDEYHKSNKHKYLTLEFISRADKLERFSTMNTNNTDLTDLYNQLNK